jgi:hypothetical protein
MHQMRARAANSLLEPATRRLLRLSTLFLLVLAALSSCGIGPANQGSTTLPSIQGSKTIVCLPPSRPSPRGGCIVQDATTGISLRVTNAYADVTSTVVQLETTNTANYPLSILQPQVALQSGQILQGAGGYSTDPTAMVVAEPVPPNDFGPLVHLVASTHFMVAESFGMNPPTLPPSPPWINHVYGITVSVPFAIPAVRSGGSIYHKAPVVEQGIGVQVQWLEYAPSRTAFYGHAGGASIDLLFSGLPEDLELLSFIRLQSQQSFGAGTEGDNGPGQVDLNIPGMTVSTPAFTVLQNPPFPTGGNTRSVDPTVGSARTVQLEVSYQGSGVPTGKPATLSISEIQRLTGGIDGNSGSVPVLPTYQITLPLA